MRHQLILQPSGRRGLVEDGETLRSAARRLGVEIESICAENSTCGKCKVLVEDGDFPAYGIRSCPSHLSPPRPDEVAYFARRSRLPANRNGQTGQARLACQARIHGDVLVTVPEESRAARQVIRKTATVRAIDIHPAIRKYYVELAPPTLSDPRSDWARLAEGLAAAMRRVHPDDPPLPQALHADYSVLLDLPVALRRGAWKATVSVWMGHEVIRVQPGFEPAIYGAAVDIGSTTIALYLCDLASGGTLAAEAQMNPQIVYGEDIVSRLQYAGSRPDGLENLHRAVIGALNQLLDRAAHQAQITAQDILEITLVGNTVMQHLALNVSPDGLGRAPFVPAIQDALDIKARDLGLAICPGGNVHMLPAVAGFVGADNVAVLLAEAPYLQDENWLIIDIGTNAELVLANRERLLCTSTPTGPALEGAHVEAGMRAAPGAIERVAIDDHSLEPSCQVIGGPTAGVRGVCGSAIIDCIAEMVRVGLLDRRGRFVKDRNTPRLRSGEHGWEYVLAWEAETLLGHDLVVTAQDVRQVQLAKAALYTAARALLQAAGLSVPDKILLAGAFGSYIDPLKAMLLGMIPDCALENVITVGNAAGDGARIALLNREKRQEAAEIARRVQHVDLPVHPSFQTQFMLALNFPHMLDSFPHIEALLPPAPPDPRLKHLLGD